MEKIAVLDPGHGGKDPGAVKYLIEKDVNLTISKACRDELKANGWKVYMTRTGEQNPGINSRVAYINKINPAVAVSIHANAGGGDGAEVYHSIVGGTGKTLAKNILNELVAIGQQSRGIKTRKNAQGRDYYGVIRDTRCPAVIVEVGFVDNRKDTKDFDTVKEQKAFGVAIAKGVMKTF